jgi:hypothetical protein
VAVLESWHSVTKINSRNEKQEFQQSKMFSKIAWIAKQLKLKKHLDTNRLNNLFFLYYETLLMFQNLAKQDFQGLQN